MRRPEFSPIGWTVVLLSITGFASALVAIWFGGEGDATWRVAGSALVAALVGAHIALLLLRGAGEHCDGAARLVRDGTIAVATLLALLLILVIAGEEGKIGARLVGVVAVLYVLGSLLTPLVAVASGRR